MTQDTHSDAWVEVIVGLLVVHVNKAGNGEEAWIVRSNGARVPVMLEDLGEEQPIRWLVEAHRFDLVGVDREVVRPPAG